MQEAENNVLPVETSDSWRSWLMTGLRREPVDRRRMRGEHKGLKKLLIEGMGTGEDRPRAWNDFSGAMIRHAVDEAMGALPVEEKRLVKLAYFGGYSNRDIARTVGLTEATVQRRLRRALGAISEYVQNGRTLGRRAVFGFMLWLSSRSLRDGTHHVVQAATVAAAATVVIVSQPGSLATTSSPARPAPAHAAGAPHVIPAIVPLIPSPTAASPLKPQVPAAPSVVAPSVVPPTVIPPVSLPPIPSPPPLPIPTPPPLPVDIKLPPV